jgi:hypothetical protein
MQFRDDLRQQTATAQAFPFRPADDTPAPLGDLFQARFDQVLNEEQSMSQARHFAPFLNQRRKRIAEVAGESIARNHDTLHGTLRQNEITRLQQMIESGEIEVDMDGLEVTGVRGTTSMGRVAASDAIRRQNIATIAQIAALNREDPSIMSDEAMTQMVAGYARAIREQSQAVLDRSPGGIAAGAAELAGTAVGVLIDPPVLLSMPLGASASVGRGILGNALRGFGIEAGIVAAIEVPIQAQVFDFKQTIDSPWTVKDAAFNVVAASIGAGLIRGTGSLAIDAVGRGGSERAFQAQRVERAEVEALLERYRKEVDAGRVAPDEDVELAARQLEDYATDEAAARIDSETHHAAVAKARQDAQDGVPTNTDAVTGETLRVPGGRPASADALQVIDPDGIGVDALTFQFKARTDDSGVSDRLRGVERFDQRLSGITIVYEDAGGGRWIVDGHQRLALAKRARAAGQAADETRLTAFILREADGVTRSEARQVAAIKNIAEGTGSAIDAAKVLREVGDAGMQLLPPLPPNSALVRGARGLAKLEDEPFQAVINELVPEQFAAIVGERIVGSREQSAVLQLLARTQPANQNQARMIVEQARAAGFETRTTTDLFGESEIAESLFKERAQVLDSAMRTIRRDRSAFQTAIDRGATLEAAGNVLDQAANAARLEGDNELLAAIAALANRTGPISDALNVAARAVREGGRPASAGEGFLDALRTHGFRDNPAGSAAGGTRPAGEGTPESRITSTEGLGKDEADALLDGFTASQAGRDLDSIYEGAEALQRVIAEEGPRIAAELPGVKFKNPGIKLRATTEEKITRKGVKPDQLTDLARAGFEIQTPELGDEIVRRLAARLEVVDEGLQVTPLGYSDRKLAIRTGPDGVVGEIQMWAPRLAEAKIAGGGQDLYTESRAFLRNGKVMPGKEAEHDALVKQSLRLYGDALAEESDAWVSLTLSRMKPQDAERLLAESPKLATRASNSSADMVGSSMRTATDMGRQPSSRLSTQPASEPSGSRTTAAGLRSEDTRTSTSPSGNAITEPAESVTIAQGVRTDSIIPPARPDRPVDLYRADTANLDRVSGQESMFDPPPGMTPEELAEINRIRAEEGRLLELPDEVVMVDGEQVVRGRLINDVFDELEATHRALEDVELCAFPRAPA